MPFKTFYADPVTGANARGSGDGARQVGRLAKLMLAPVACLLAMPSYAEPASDPRYAQIEAERHAIALVARSDVQAAADRAEADWRRESPGLLPESYGQLHASVRELLFMVALQIIDDDPRRPQVIEISRPPHRSFGTDVPGGRWGINNPDTVYFTIPIEPASRYVVTGHRHGVGPIDANFTVQTGADWVATDNLAQHDLKLEQDGTYRITVDGQPTAGRQNHLRIGGASNVLLIRNTLADWSRERPDTLTVTRLSGPPAGAPASDAILAQRIITRLHAVVDHSVHGVLSEVLRQSVNVIAQPGSAADKPGFLVTQRNTLAHFRLADDEALIATFDPGGAAYATFPVMNVWGVAPNARDHQNSLNNLQATPNADGTITVVLSNWDPGIANWVDATGLREGIIMLRWQLLSEARTGAHEPFVTAKLVKRDALWKALPTSTSKVTADKRGAQLRNRASGYDKRFTPS